MSQVLVRGIMNDVTHRVTESRGLKVLKEHRQAAYQPLMTAYQDMGSL